MFTLYGRQRGYIPVGKMAVNVLIFEVRIHVLEPNLRTGNLAVIFPLKRKYRIMVVFTCQFGKRLAF